MATEAKIKPALTTEDVELLRDFARNWHPNNQSPHSNDTMPARNRALDLAGRLEALLRLFTREDVETTREAISDLELADDAMRGSTSTTRLFLADLAERIEASLPPEE